MGVGGGWLVGGRGGMRTMLMPESAAPVVPGAPAPEATIRSRATVRPPARQRMEWVTRVRA